MRTSHLDRFDERTIGELADAFHAGDDPSPRTLLGVDPFDQPAVEEGKILAKRYLAEAKG